MLDKFMSAKAILMSVGAILLLQTCVFVNTNFACYDHTVSTSFVSMICMLKGLADNNYTLAYAWSGQIPLFFLLRLAFIVSCGNLQIFFH